MAPPSATAPPTALPAAPTATIQWFLPTSTPTILPSPTVLPTPDPHTGLGPAVLADGFIPGSPWQAGKFPGGTVRLASGELVLAVTAAKGSLASIRSAPVLGDFYAEVSASPSLCRGGDEYGLIFRQAGSASYYRWVLTCDGQERLEQVQNGVLTPLQKSIPRAGPPVPSQLAVRAEGSQLTFYINAIFQFSARDSAFASGSLGVFARAAGDTPLTVSFSGLSIFSLAAQG